MRDEEFAIHSLRETLKLLALPAGEQVAALPPYVVVPDELAFTFDDAYLHVPLLHERGDLSATTKESLDAIDALLRACRTTVRALSACTRSATILGGMNSECSPRRRFDTRDGGKGGPFWIGFRTCQAQDRTRRGVRDAPQPAPLDLRVDGRSQHVFTVTAPTTPG